MAFFRILFTIISLLFLSNSLIAQSKGDGKKPVPKKEKKGEKAGEKRQEPKSARAIRREARAQWRQNRRNEWIEKKKIRDHDKRLQTKATLKRMRAHRRKAERNNAHQRDPFYNSRICGKYRPNRKYQNYPYR